MARTKEDIEACISALQAIVLIQDSYASSTDGAQRIADIANMLQMRKSDMGKYGGIRKQVSEAIYRGCLNSEPPVN